MDIAQILPYLFAAIIATFSGFFVSLFWELIKSKLFRPVQGSDYQKAYETYENSINKTHGKFLEGPWRSFFLDRKFIENQFRQISPLKTTEISSEKSYESSKGIETNIPLPISGEMGTKTATKQHERMEVEESTEVKCRNLVSFLLKERKIKLGIEEAAYNYFSSALSILLFKSFGKIKPDLIEEILPKIKEKTGSSEEEIREFIKNNEDKLEIAYNILSEAASRQAYTDSKIEEIKSYVEDFNSYAIMEGAFTVESLDDCWSLIYNHPLNALLISHEKELRIRISCKKDSDKLTERGRNKFSESLKKEVKLKVFGTLEDFDEKNWVLTVEPIAIYQ